MSVLDLISSITCPRCHMTSYNKNDIREGYCGSCNQWTTPRGDEGRPYALIDVDGMLNPMLRCAGPPRCNCHAEWNRHRVIMGSGQRLTVVLNPRHGEWLLELAERTGAELAWGTTWEEEANEHIGPRIGLPRLPVAPLARKFSRSIASSKALGIVPWTGGRPFVWFDDEPDLPSQVLHEAPWPHRVITTPEETGLAREHIDDAIRWLTEDREILGA